MIPNKLKMGDEIRVIAPSRSSSIISEELKDHAIQKLEELGFSVTFSANSAERDILNSSSIQSRLEDLHQAFADPKVKGILTVIGGYNSNQLLRNIDYSLIKENPKIFCGYSDITVLSNAIYAKTGLVTYSGPHFSTFGMLKGIEYTIEYFKNCLIADEEFEVGVSKLWSDDSWFKNQENRQFVANEGWFVINNGVAEGTIIGGNLCTLNFLQGTEFMPSLANSILFIEDDYEVSPEAFDRDLHL
jgi:muramoyltetrapeptide carboxypeptidase